MDALTDIIRNADEQLADSMRYIKLMHSDDEEVCHILMDNAMCDFLEGLGFTEAVKIFKETKKWYA